MSRPAARRVLALSILSVLGAYLAIARAADPPAAHPAADVTKDAAKAQPAKPSDNLRPVERALESPIALDFDKVALKDAADFLAKKLGINVWLDNKQLSDAGITGDTEVSIKVKSITLRSALRLMLGEKEMNFVADGDNGLLITTDVKAKEKTEVRIYDASGFESPPVNPYGEPPAKNEAVINLITKTIAPPTWPDAGGTGSIVSCGDHIIVSQTPEVHEQIAELLSLLHLLRDESQKVYGQGIIRLGQFTRGPEAKIQAALKARTDFKFDNAALSDLVNWLGEKGIEPQLDIKSLADAQITSDTKFSFRAKQVSIESGLKHILQDKELDTIIDHEVLLITTKSSEERTFTDLYPVADLLTNKSDAGQSVADLDELVAAITTAVAPSSWEQNGGHGLIVSVPFVGALLVSQSENEHGRIEDLLTKLRAARAVAQNSAPREKAGSKPEPTTRIYSLGKGNEKASEEYISVIRHLIAPESWAGDRFFIGKAPGCIVVRQLPESQEKIKQLLNELHAFEPQVETKPIDNSPPPAAAQPATSPTTESKSDAK